MVRQVHFWGPPKPGEPGFFQDLLLQGNSEIAEGSERVVFEPTPPGGRLARVKPLQMVHQVHFGDRQRP